MGNVTIRSGLGFSEQSGARYIDMSAVTTTEERMNSVIKLTIPEDKAGSQPWAPWGDNNMKPMEMAEDIESCGILNSIIDGKSRFALNNGVQAVITEINKETGQREIKEYVTDQEILDFLDLNDTFFNVYGWMKDQVGFAQGVCRYGLTRTKNDPKIVRFIRDDVTEFRYQKKNTKGVIENIYLAAEWNKIRGAEDKRLIITPHLNPFNPAGDLLKKVRGGAGYQFALTFRYPGWQRHYYSMPLWYAALKWVKIAQGVPEMKAAIFENSIHVKYVVIIHEKYWERAFTPAVWKKYTPQQREDARQKLYDEIDKFLVGKKNAYKSIFATGYRDADGKTWAEIEIKPVEDTQREGQLLPDSAAANSEIAFAMHYNNTLVGGNQVQGPYDKGNGGSNIRESILMQVIFHELERQNVRRNLMVPAIFNGWTKKFPGLDFIIPATVLTTLDTGSGTKDVLPGSSKKKEASDGTN